MRTELLQGEHLNQRLWTELLESSLLWLPSRHCYFRLHTHLTFIWKKKKKDEKGSHWRKQARAKERRLGKKFGPFLDLCVSSLRRGHANLLCIVPILSDVPEGTTVTSQLRQYKHVMCSLTRRCGISSPVATTRFAQLGWPSTWLRHQQ